MTEPIDTADVVYHTPTEETWVVAYVKAGRVAWCGWPPGTVPVAECELRSKATPEQRGRLLRALAACDGADPRRAFALQRLAQEEDRAHDAD